MSEDSEEEKHKKLAELIRRIAKDVCFEILEEHLADFKHEGNMLRKGRLDE